MKKQSPAEGFTLIEILVAVTVLAVLAALVVQVTFAVTQGTKISNRGVDAASQARLAFDRLGMDLAAMPRRQDINFVAGNSGDDLLMILSGVASADSSLITSANRNRGLSLVAYRVSGHSGNEDSRKQPRSCLLRAAMPIPWTMPNGTAYMGLQENGYPVRFGANGSYYNFPSELMPKPPSTAPAGATDYDVLAPGVIKVVVGFQLYPDNKEVYYGDGSVSAEGRGQIVYSPPMCDKAPGPGNSYVDVNRIASLVIGLVVVDVVSLKLLDKDQVDALAGAFSNPPNEGELPIKAWMTATSNLANLPSSVPLPARQAVRLYQRFYPITPYGSRNP